MNPSSSLAKLLSLGFLSFFAFLLSACSGTVHQSKSNTRAPSPNASETVSQNAESTGRAPRSNPQSMETISLEKIQEKENTLLLEVTIAPDSLDVEEKHRRLIEVVQMYENYIIRFPDSELGYIFYGKLLRKIGMTRKANNMFVRANAINGNIPVVKQQIGNFLAEEGMFELALPYFLSAIELDSKVAIYHYQLGELIYTYYEAFLSKKIFDRKTLDAQMLNAFRLAAELAPNEHTYVFRYAEAFYDIQNPNWDSALTVWQSLFDKAKSDRERDIIRLHQARIYIITGRYEYAKPLLSTINQPALEEARQALLLQVH